MRINKKAFSMTEMMLVVLVIGIMAVFAIPGYEKSRDRTLEKVGLTSLKQLHAAQKIYYSRNGAYWPAGPVGASQTVSEAALGVSFLDDALEYSCRGTDGASGNNFFCYAEAHSTNPNASKYFILRVDAGPIREKKDNCGAVGNECNPGCDDSQMAGSQSCPSIGTSRSAF